jgi:hypothetical protein
MRKYMLWYTVLALAAGQGCSSNEVPAPGKKPAPTPPKKVPRLDDPIELSLAKLRTTARRRLAELADKLADEIRWQDQKHRSGELAYLLLPNLRLPLCVPVFTQAKYAPRSKMSLPPYLPEGQKDREIALHLARFGDTQAALRLVDRRDGAVVGRIKALRPGRNYPLEWTRLVGLHLHAAQVRLATGEPDGARQLIGLHRQLQQVLDPRARKGVLGATLLGRGRAALARAAAAWNQANQPELARQVEAALAAWGRVPTPPTVLSPGASRAEVARLLGVRGEGRLLRGGPRGRAFDLLALPFTPREAEAVLACFGADDRLTGLLVVYRPPVADLHRNAAEMAYLLEEGKKAKGGAGSSGGYFRSYRRGPMVWDVAVVPQNTAVGAVVRLAPARPSAAGPVLARGFGDLSLDRSLEQNRVRLAKHQRGKKLTVTDSGELGRVKNPLGALPLDRAVLEGEEGPDVLQKFTLNFGRGGGPSLVKLAGPLWAAAGPGAVGVREGKYGHDLVLTWQDARTRYVLRLPEGKRDGPEFEATDRTPAGELAGRAARVAERDRKEWRKRLKWRKGDKGEKPLVRVQRVWEGVGLGMSQEDLGEVLPGGDDYPRLIVPGGLGIVYRDERSPNPGYVPRELFVRFRGKQVAEVRVRYVSAAGRRGRSGVKQLLEEIIRKSGAPRQEPGSWAKVWTGYPARKPAPVLYRWEDDTTRLTCQRDSEGVEVVVVDRAPEREAGTPFQPVAYIPLGPEDCRLGEGKAELKKRWAKTKPEWQEGVLILYPPKGDYDQVQVAFDTRGKAVTITARLRQQWNGNPGPAKLAEAVSDAWAARLSRFGWPRRQDRNARRQVSTFTGHDEATRVKVFWEGRGTAADPVRLYTEWQALAALRK